jgi:hypothetical protein
MTMSNNTMSTMTATDIPDVEKTYSGNSPAQQAWSTKLIGNMRKQIESTGQQLGQAKALAESSSTRPKKGKLGKRNAVGQDLVSMTSSVDDTANMSKSEYS